MYLANYLSTDTMPIQHFQVWLYSSSLSWNLNRSCFLPQSVLRQCYTTVMQKTTIKRAINALQMLWNHSCCFVVYEWMAFIVGCFFSYLIIRGSHLATFDWPSTYEVAWYFLSKTNLTYQRVKSWTLKQKLAHVRSIQMYFWFNFSFKICLSIQETTLKSQTGLRFPRFLFFVNQNASSNN